MVQLLLGEIVNKTLKEKYPNIRTTNNWDNILEDSNIFPRTNYAVQKYAGEMLVRNNAKEWLVTRPLFAYGLSLIHI